MQYNTTVSYVGHLPMLRSAPISLNRPLVLMIKISYAYINLNNI